MWLDVARNRARLANDAWEALMTAHANVTKTFADDDTWTEVSMREYDVLYALAKAERPLTISELNRGVLLSQPAMSRLVERMVSRRLLSREADGKDGRAVRVGLTDAGRLCQRRTGAKHARCVRRGLDSLSVSELEALEETCRKLSRRGEG